jgi:MFS family permease
MGRQAHPVTGGSQVNAVGTAGRPTRLALVVARRVARRDFRLYWLAGAASLLGSHASGLVLPLLILARTGDAVVAGAVATVVGVVRLVLSPLAGVYADRYSRRVLLTGSAMIAGTVWVGVAVGIATDRLSLPWLLVAVVVAEVASAQYDAASSGAVRRVLPIDRPEKAAAALNGRTKAADLVGPSIGGALYQLAQWIPFVFDALCHVVALSLVRSVHTDLGPDCAEREEAEPSVYRELVAGLTLVWSQPLLKFVMLWVAGVNLAFGALFFHVILVAQRDGASAASIGLIMTFSGAAGVLGALGAPWAVGRFGAPAIVVGVSWLLVVVVVLLALTRTTWQFGLVLAAVGLVSPSLVVIFQTKAIMATPDGMQSRVGTVVGTIGEGAAAFGPALAGVLAGAVSRPVIAVVFGAGLALLACYATANRVHVRPAKAVPAVPNGRG